MARTGYSQRATKALTVRRMTSPEQDFWAITTYFNLMNAATRFGNYQCFRRRLEVPLLTVEWHPDGVFQLNNGDADLLVQISGGDLMWQKERLLTIAVPALPDHVKYVAWVDCDILFENRDWKHEARRLLERKSVIQLFSEVAFPDETASKSLVESDEDELDCVDVEQISSRESFLGMFARLKEDVARFDLDQRFQNEHIGSSNAVKRPAPGFAWAAPSAFLRMNGIYDRGIMGGGDMLFCYGISGLAQKLIENHNAAGWSFYGDCPSYRSWASHAAEECAGRHGCLDGRIMHLFHGSLRDRQYKSRVDGLAPYAIDLDQDISAEGGKPWSWRRDRDRLNEYFLNYLRGRKEG